MKTLLRYLFILVPLLTAAVVTAQPVEQLVKVIVTPDHVNWQYQTGEKALFGLQVLFHNNPLTGYKAYYEIGPEKMEPSKKDSILLNGKTLTLDGGTMSSPGFLRCVVNVEYGGKVYRGLATAGYNQDKIKPTVKQPADFVAFWDKAKSELANIPPDPKMVLMADRCTRNVDVYVVTLQNYGNTRLYGILSVPKKEGRYPALLRVPGAGVRPYSPDVELAEKGIITFVIGIHGIPVTMDPGVYTDLASGALREYFNYNLDNKDRYYYKRVYLGCVRANDFLVSLPQFDGRNLAVAGGSQGGALSVITASLDSRVKFLAAMYPALCDVTGYLDNRAGGWPHLFNNASVEINKTKEKLETVGYYDVVNFARGLKIPGYYTWGFNDETCPPTSMYSAYNVITSQKELELFLETGHWTYPEQNIRVNNWIVSKLTGR